MAFQVMCVRVSCLSRAKAAVLMAYLKVQTSNTLEKEVSGK